MRVAVTGRDGQVARSLAERGAAAGHEMILLGRPALELAGPAEEIAAALQAAHPDVIVSAAAYTMVDKAESERELAFRVNQHGAAAVAKAAADLAVPLIHLSTDYVFDGRKSLAYVEADEPGPTSVYGASKLGGEQAVLAAQGNSAILRVAWVYSPFGTNFVKTMLRLAETRDEIAVVADQVGNPTSALDIADAVLKVASNLLADDNPERRGVFHLTAAGEASWAEFADQIFDYAEKAGGPSARVKPISTADYPTPARRPANSRLNSDRIRLVHGVGLSDWRSSLQSVVSRLVA